MYPDEDIVRCCAEELIKCIKGPLDAELVKGAVDNMVLVLCVPDCPIPDKRAVRESMAGLALKFEVHGYEALASGLERSVKDLLESSDLDDYNPDLPWNMLKLLSALSWRPMDHAREQFLANQEFGESAGPEEEEFDWGAHLREGVEVFHPTDDDDSSDWSQLTDEEMDDETDTDVAGSASEAQSRKTSAALSKSKTKAARQKRAEERRRRRGPEEASDNPSEEDEFGDPEEGDSRRIATKHRPLVRGSEARREVDTFLSAQDLSVGTLDVGGHLTAMKKFQTLGVAPCLFPLPPASLCSLSSVDMIPAPPGSRFQHGNLDDPYRTKTNFLTRSHESKSESQMFRHAWSETAAHVVKEERQVNMAMLEAYAAASKADESLNGMTHDPKHFSKHKTSAPPGPPSESLRGLYFTDVGEHDGVSVLPEYHVLRDVLWMLVAPTACRCFGLDEAGLYQPRPDVTLVDVSVIVTWTVLREFCPYMDMVVELNAFHGDIHGGEEPPRPPSTYRAYWHAVSHYYTKFKQAVYETMATVVKQESINTLLSVRQTLRPRLDELAYIVRLHRRAVCDWRKEPDWFSAVKLLSVLYQSMSETSDAQRAAISMQLFVKSFRPYVNIINSYLTRDEDIGLEDEFIIYKGSDMDASMRDTWHEGVLVRPYSERLRNIAPLPSVLKCVLKQILLGCKSAYILRELHMEEQSTHDSAMYSEFLVDISDAFSRYSDHPSTDSGCTSDVGSDNDDAEPALAFTGLADPMAGHLINLGDPFMQASFAEFFEFEDGQAMGGEKRRPVERGMEKLWQRVERSMSALTPYQHLMERAMSALVDDKYRALGRLINAVLRDKLHIKQHLELLRATFLIESGDIAAVFFQQIAQKVKDEPCWLYSHYLTSNLNDYLADRMPDANRFRVLVDDRFLEEDIILAVEGIEIKYNVDWPLSLIIAPNLSLYNEIFRLLLKLKWSLASLQRLRFDQQTPGKKAVSCHRRLARWQTLRFWLLNAVAGAHNFTMSHVVHSFSPELDDIIKNGNDFDKLVRAHSEYLEGIHRLCVNPFQGSQLEDQFRQLLKLAQCLVDYWTKSNQGKQDSKLQLMEELYCQLHSHIGIELRNFVPPDSRISIESLLSVFCYPLRPAFGEAMPEAET